MISVGLVGVEWGTALSCGVGEEGFMLEMCLQQETLSWIEYMSCNISKVSKYKD